MVGLLDDWLKFSRAHNVGLNKRAKSLGLLVVSVGFAVGTIVFTEPQTQLSFTRADSPGIELGEWGWAVVAVLTMLASTNAVNLTDGLDGLAAGSSILAFAAFTVIGFWAFSNPEVYGVDHALDLAVVAASMLGACAGFLWWNAAPARIFMGDTGSLGSSRSRRSGCSADGGSSAWRRSTITSSSAAGPRPPSSSGSG
jgi:phospho-N-acetylmuramoyl-pentapeptide-transferase